MTASVVKVYDNEGPNPGNTQLPNGLTTAVNFTTSDPAFFLTTCATYGGAHADRSLTSKLGTKFTLEADVIGGQGNLNTDQEFAAWYAPTVIPGADVLTQLFNGGDNDYQALWGVQMKGLGPLLLPMQGSHQDSLPPGAGVINAGPAFEITAAMCPCVILIATCNISELGDHYTPSTGHGVSHFGNWWSFAGEGKGLPNLCVGAMYVSTPGSYQPTCNAQSTVAEAYQTVAGVFADTSGAVAPALAPVQLTPAQLAALNAGQPLTLLG